MTDPATSPASRGVLLGARRRRADAAPVDYDFRRPIQMSREHARLLQLGFDTFARQATNVFTSALRTVCSVSLLSVEQRSYLDYVEELTAPTYLVVFTLEPLPGLGVLELPLATVMGSIDHMLGGHGSTHQPVRPLSDIESSVFESVVHRLLGELRYAMEGTLGFEPQVHEIEYSPQFAQAAAPTDVTVVAKLDVRLGETARRATICLPFSSVLPALTRAAAPAPASERERAHRALAADSLRRSFDEVPVEVGVRFAPTSVDPRVLSSLSPGDVIPLGHLTQRPLDVVVDGQVFAHATPGTHGRRLAALVVPDPEETP